MSDAYNDRAIVFQDLEVEFVKIMREKNGICSYFRPTPDSRASSLSRIRRMLASANSFSKDNVSRTDRFSPPELVAVMPSGEFSSFKFAHLIKTIPKSDREEASSPSPKLNQKTLGGGGENA